MLAQTKVSFSVPETWVVPLAPTPASAIEIDLHVLCDGFPEFGHFVDQKNGNFLHVATDATTNSIEITDLRAPRPKNGPPPHDSHLQAIRGLCNHSLFSVSFSVFRG